MILAKAPLRVSLFGGGSDIPDFYKTEVGATISMAIDKYVYVTVMHTPHNHIKVSYSEQEVVTNLDEVKNDIVREALRLFGITSNIEITTFADIPTGGTGLGGSSAFTCALVAALEAYKPRDRKFSKYDIAELACEIEMVLCDRKIGKQDQYASAFGGFNYIEYHSNSVKVTALDDVMGVNECMTLVPIIKSREETAHGILDSIDFEEKREEIRRLAQIAKDMKDIIPCYVKYSNALARSWLIKKQVSDKISNQEIDSVYNKLYSNDLKGCKLLGAGGGGYMLVMHPYYPSKILDLFSDRVCLNFNISYEGAKVVYND